MLRLRMKVWTDPKTQKRYLMPAAFVNPRRGGDTSDTLWMKAYAMSDEDTKVVDITAYEWDRLPFYYFKEDGEVVFEDRPKRLPDLISG